MARLLWTVVLLAVFQSAVSKPLGLDKRWEEVKVKHEWTSVPKGWVEVGRPPADYSLKMNIGLKQDRFEELLGHLYEVSDPEHRRCAFAYPYYIDCSLTRSEHPDTATTFRKKRSTSSLLPALRPSNLSKLG